MNVQEQIQEYVDTQPTPKTDLDRIGEAHVCDPESLRRWDNERKETVIEDGASKRRTTPSVWF